MMKKILKRAISIMMVAAILATGLVTVLGSLTASAAEVVTEEWVYDFKSGTGSAATMPAYLKAHPTKGNNGGDLNNWMTYSSELPSGGKQTYFDENGMHYYSYYGSSDYSLDAKNGTSWMRGFFLWDADVARQNAAVRAFSDGKFGDGSVRNTFPDTADDANLYVSYGMGPDPTNTAGLVALDNGLYSVSVKFKVSEMNTSTSKIYIGVCVSNYATRGNDYNLSYQNYTFDRAIITDVMDDWATLTVFVDGSLFKGTGKNYLKVGVSNDKFVADGTYNQVDFESIKVKRLYDATNDETGIRYALTNAFTDGKMQSIDAPGYEPVLMSANESVVLPDIDTGSVNKEFYRWEPYDVSENFFTNYSAINGYHNNTDYADQALNYLTTYPGSTFKPGKGAFALAARTFDAAAAPTTTTNYEFDIDGFLANKDGLWTQGSAFMSTGIYNTATASADGGVTISDATGGSDAWFYDTLPSDNGSYHRLGFYTGLDTANAGKWDGNALKIKNGYTYNVELTYKVELNEGAPHKSVNIGMGHPVIKNNLKTWANTHSLNVWRTLDATDGYVTVKATFEGNLYNDNHYLCINMSCNGNYVTIKDLKVTETFVGTVHAYGTTEKVGATLPELPGENVVINGQVYTGTFYADEACTIPVTAFNSKVREVWAGTRKIYDVEGVEYGDIAFDSQPNGDIIVAVRADEGYKLAANGIAVKDQEGNTHKLNVKNGTDADGQGSGLQFIWKNGVGYGIDNVAVSFVAENATSIDVTAASIKGGESAGLRFRGRVAKGSDVDEVGFVLLPTAMLDGDLTVETAGAVIGKTAFDGIVYDDTEAYRDFQVKLTGLSDKLKGMEISCVMYVKDSAGAYTYSDVSASTYDAIKAIYDENGLGAGTDY